MELRGRVALVTGAGRRLGAAIARGLADAGCDLAVHYHASAEGAEESARYARSSGRSAQLFAADLRDPVAARALPERVARECGRLDILVNSAGVMVREPLAAVTPDSWDATFAVNLRAAFFLAQGAAPHLARERGSIVNITDVGAVEPWPAYLPYGASKAGLAMLTRGLARALAPDVRVNAVAPGPVLLPDEWDPELRERFAQTTPLGLGAPDDVVAAVRFLLESGDYVTGVVLPVDGGRLAR